MQLYSLILITVPPTPPKSPPLLVSFSSSLSSSSSSSSSTTQGWSMSCCSRDCALGQAQVAVQPQVSGMLGGQAIAAIAVHIAEVAPVLLTPRCCC